MVEMDSCFLLMNGGYWLLARDYFVLNECMKCMYVCAYIRVRVRVRVRV